MMDNVSSTSLIICSLSQLGHRHEKKKQKKKKKKHKKKKKKKHKMKQKQEFRAVGIIVVRCLTFEFRGFVGAATGVAFLPGVRGKALQGRSSVMAKAFALRRQC